MKMKETAIRMMKRAVSGALAAFLAFQIVAVPSPEAEETSNYCQGDPGYGVSGIPLEQQLEELLADPTLTTEQRAEIELKVQEAIALRDGNYVQTRASYPTVTLSVPAYTQDNGHFCGPATTRQTLGYLGMVVPGGYVPPSQSAIARELGTTNAGTEWTAIQSYINGFTFMSVRNNYLEYKPTSQTNMEAAVYTALTRTRPTPPILQVNTSGDSSILGYSTGGHYLNISGIRTSGGVNYFEFTDPNRGRQGLSPKFNVKTEDAYDIMRNHWAKHMLY